MATPKKKLDGSVPKYTRPADMQEKIDAYFKMCDGELLKDDEGNYVINKYGVPVVINSRPPTMTGLAIALGFKSRTSFMKYEAKKEFCDVIALAKARVEQYAEERLYDKDGANGAKFILQNNFKDWDVAAKLAAQEASNGAVKIICDIPKLNVSSCATDGGAATPQESGGGSVNE